MTKYYSNHPDFSAGLQASSMTGSVSYARSQVTNALSDIKEVTEVVQNEGLSFLYSPVGDAELGKEMPEITFATSYDKVEKMLNLATRIHSEVLERIDNKFTTGIDASLESLNSVNGSNNPYTTTHLSYQVIKMKSETQGIAGTETKYYTLAELLDYQQSPIAATKEVYLKRVSDLRKIFEKQHLDDGPVYLSNKTDEELLSMFFKYQQAGNYSSLKHFQWQEDNKAWLEPLEAYLGIGLIVVSLIASAVSFGAASPGVVAGATLVASGAGTLGLAYEATSGGYAAATGHTMLAGTELDTDDRIWAGVETLWTLGTLGLGKGLKAAGVTDDIINAVNKTGNGIGDGVGLLHTGYDYVVKGEDPTMSLIGFGIGKLGGAGLARAQNKSQSINVLTNTDESPLFSTNNTELEYRNYVDRKLKSGSEPLSITEWLERSDIANQNLTNNNDFSTGSIANVGEMPPFKIKSTELEYQNYVDRKLKSSGEPLSMTEWLERRDIANQNITNNNDFSTGSIADLGETPPFKIKNTELDVSEVKEPVKPSTTREIVDKKLQEYGVSWDEFNRLRDTRVTEMSPSEYDMMIDIRKSIPKPTERTVLQKIIPIENADNYFGDQGWGVGGFISERGDVVDIKTIEDAVKRLRLDYEGSPFVETMIDTNGNRIAVRDQNGNLKLKTDGFVRIEFRTHDTDYIDIPIGNRDGTNLDDDPASGNGFIKSDEYLIPEYKVVDPDTKFPSVSLTEGSKLYVNIGGEEVLFGVVKNGTMYYV